MTAFRGLFVKKDATRGTTAVEARKSLAGIFHKTAAGAPRPGLLTSVNVAGTSGWAYSVPAVQWVLSRGAVDGAVLAGNDGTVNVATSAAPATGSRIDIIYVLHRDVDNADADSESVIGVAQGAASGTPVAPTLPAGAMEIARATVAAGNANTLAATITQTAPITGLAGADLVVSFGQAQFATRIPSPVAGMRVFSTAENSLYVRVGTAWQVLWSDTGVITDPAGIFAPASGFTVSSLAARRRDAQVSIDITIEGAMNAIAGAQTSVGSFQSGWLPVGNVTAGAMFASSGFQNGIATLATNGALQVWKETAGARGQVRTSLRYTVPNV